MNIRTEIPLTKDAFLRWAEAQEGRYEFVEGKIVMMVGASREQTDLHEKADEYTALPS